MNSVELIKFDNGLTLAHYYNPNVLTVGIMFTAKAGLIIEKPEQQGISHFLEHLSFKGTEKRDAYQTTFELDKLGANSNAYTTKQNTSYYALCLAEKADAVMDILSDMYFNSCIKEKEFKSERKVVYEEIKESKDDNGDIVYSALSSLYFKGSPLAKEILGTRNTLSKLTPEDVREYRDTHYTANNTIITIAGNVNREDAIALVKKYCLNSFKRENVVYEIPEIKTNSGVIISKKDIQQNYLEIFLPGFASMDDRLFTLKIFSSIFGSSYSSRLYQQLREKKALCYSINTSAVSFSNVGVFNISSSFNADRTEEMLDGIISESKKFLNKGLTQEELDLVKTQIKTAFAFGQESISSMMKAVNSAAFYDEALDYNDYIEKYSKVTIDDIMDVAKYTLDFSKAGVSLLGKDIKLDVKKKFGLK